MLSPRSPSPRQDISHLTRLLELVQHNTVENTAEIERLLSSDPTLANTLYQNEDSPAISYSILYCAAAAGNLDACRLLVNHRAHLNSGSESALFGAISSGDASLVQYFITQNPTLVNTKSAIYPFNKPLHLTEERGLEEITQILLDNGADESARNARKQKPGDLAAGIYLDFSRQQEPNVEDETTTPLLKSTRPVSAPEARPLFSKQEQERDYQTF